ncbi:MAG: nucleotide exchange factor GrpE, partial [Clostridia bacterium]|nr:nucleotide exchange factor GrpE [Clostridia bacterium]
YAEKDILEGFLPILDNFERAISMDDNNFGDETSKFLEGFRMVYKQTKNLLEKFDRSLVEQAFVGSDYNIEAYDDGTSGGDASSSLEDSSSSIFEDLSNDEDIGFLFDGNGGARDILMAFFIPAIALFIFIYGIGKALMGSSSNKSGLLSRIVSNITRKEKKEVLYSRDIPLDGSLPEAYLALDTMDELPGKGAIIEAYLLKWMKNGWCRVEEKPEKRLGGLLGDKMTPSIVFSPDSAEATKGVITGVEEQLWRILHAAAGEDDILQEKELKHYAQAHYERLEDFFENSLNEGMRSAKASHRVEDVAEKKLLFTSHKTVLTETGKQKFLELIGFRKFLKEFTIINEREARDVGLWGDYLTYAALFGIADEVAEQFKELVPDFFTNPQAYGYYGAGWDAYDMIWMMHWMNRFSNTAYNSYMAGRSAQEINTASSGGGGFSSFGGGGGFSGGGIGGGGR